MPPSMNNQDNNPNNNPDKNTESHLTNLQKRIEQSRVNSQNMAEGNYNSQADSAGGKMHKKSDYSGLSMASRACTELVLSIGVCGFLGYQGDLFLNTKPGLFILGLLIGTAVGFMGVYRITNNLGMSVGYSQDLKSRKDVHIMDEQAEQARNISQISNKIDKE